jgi:uncharacterized protein (DUF58 family)
MPFQKAFGNRISRWLNKRIPAAKMQALDHQKIFIFPTRFGFWFLMLAGLLFVLGTNYQNNLMRLLCTFLLSLFLLHLFVSYINFSRLKIRARHCQPAFANENGSLPIVFMYQNHYAQGLVHLSWWRTPNIEHVAVQLEPDETRGLMPFKFNARGTHTLPRLTLRCDYPLGLFKCWTHLDLDQQVVIYPAPKRCTIRLLDKSSEEHEGHVTTQGGFDEFHNLREFLETDSLSNVAWKHAAKSANLMVKTFEQPVGISGWLTFSSCESPSIEEKLAELAYQILILCDKQQVFGLSIPGVDIEPATGNKHKHQCLTALAQFPATLQRQALS